MNWRQKYIFSGIHKCALLRGSWTNRKKIKHNLENLNPTPILDVGLTVNVSLNRQFSYLAVGFISAE